MREDIPRLVTHPEAPPITISQVVEIPAPEGV
jgi:hypothetical protein